VFCAPRTTLRALTRVVRGTTPTLALAAALAVGPLAALASTKPDEAALVATFGALWITLSIYLYQLLRLRFPTLSSVAVVAILWGGLAAVSTLSSHPCDVSNITQASCSTPEVANSTLAAMIMPFLPILVILPFAATKWMYRGVSRAAHKAATWAGMGR
jgi:hypothetical protein